MTITSTFDGTGLRVVTLPETIANMEESIASSPEFGPDLSTGPYSVAGMIIRAAAPEVADTNDALEQVYQGWDIDSATGVQLDNIAALNGLTRQAATKSDGAVTFTGTPATAIPAGHKDAVPGGEQVATEDEVTIGGGGTVDAESQAVNAGPLSFGIGSITTIVDAVAGLTGVTNAAAFTVGDPQESDSDLRIRIKRSQAAGGSSTDFAIRSRLEDLDDVTAAAAVSNRSSVVDGNGTPGHTVWIIVDGTADAETIAATIWGQAGLPSGIDSRGANEAIITDSNGYEQTVRWDDADTIRTWITATLTMNSDYPGYPGGASGDQAVEDAIVAWGESSLNLAGAVEPQPIDTWVANADNPPITGVPGIAKLVITLSITAAPGPTDDDPIEMAINERATIAVGDVLVVST